MKKILKLYYETNSGIYRSTIPNTNTQLNTSTILLYISYPCFDVLTNMQIGFLKLEITSTPSQGNNASSPSLNSYSFTFYFTGTETHTDAFAVNTRYDFIADAQTPFPTFTNRILSFSGTPWCTKGKISVRPEGSKRLVTIEFSI